MLNWAAKKAGNTKAEEVGDLAVSMLQGKEGNQARELKELIDWLKEQSKPDIICLSNSLLLGLVKSLKESIGAPIVCLLQNEAPYIDSMPEGLREEVWKLMAERVPDVSRFIAPSRYYAERICDKLKVPAKRMSVIYNGIAHEGFEARPVAPNPPVLGYFTRMCKDKGLDTLIDAFIKLKQDNHIHS